MPLFDTHAHLSHEQLAPNLEEVLASARSAGLIGITAIGTTVESSQQCLDLANKHLPLVYAAIGIHPNNCKDATEEDWKSIVEMASSERAVAIGETGLDRHWDYCPIEIQENWFAQHIELSFEVQKPLVIHMRDCEADILRMLETHKRDGQIIGIMHSFAGSWETAQKCLEMGMYISFAGMVTFKKSGDLRHIAHRVPADRILIETDAPFLSPHPMRSVRPNQPSLVEHTARCIAEARGVSFEELSELTTQNAKAVFGIATGS